MSTTEPADSKPGHAASREQLRKRLRRAEGQVRGIAKMVEDDRQCIDVITQISALQAALDKVALALVHDHVQHCVVEGSEQERAERVDELIGTIGRLLR